MSLRVIVVDDSVIFRKAVSDTLSSFPDVEVAATAPNGKIAITRIGELRPDLVTLDMEMPVMGGIDFLKELRVQKIEIGVIVLSAITRKGGDLTMKALELGAFDFITKPSEGSSEKNYTYLASELGPRIRAFRHQHDVKKIFRGEKETISPPKAVISSRIPGNNAPPKERSFVIKRPEMVAIGISTGGPNALATMLPSIPDNLNVPIFIVQHMPQFFTQSLAGSLAEKCRIKVKEATDGEVAMPNTAYIAPGGTQMKLKCGPEKEKMISITDDPPENHCKPSVDYFFRSVANQFPGLATAVIMTGMGNDGVLGLRLIKRNGGLVIAQDEVSSVVWGMPGEAVKAGVVDQVVPLSSLASEIVKSVKGY